MVLISIHLITNNVEHFFTYLFDTPIASFVKCLNFQVLLFVLSCKSCLYSVITNPLSDICYVNIFSQMWFAFSDSLTVPFESQRFNF